MCQDCCDPPIDAPPQRQQHAIYPPIDCTLVTNVRQICAKDSCCYTYEETGADIASGSGDDEGGFCDTIDSTYSDENNMGGIPSICWYCCSQPIDIAADPSEGEPERTFVWNDGRSSQGEDRRKQIKLSVVSVVFAMTLLVFWEKLV